MCPIVNTIRTIELPKPLLPPVVVAMFEFVLGSAYFVFEGTIFLAEGRSSNGLTGSG